LFLGKLRTTLIPVVAVPVSLIGTFAVMLALGFSANTVSLLALVLAIGIVVDDAIVVVENVERVMEEEPHLSAKEATRKAMGEIVAPIIAITLVLLSVFVPVAFIPGISGQLFQQFAVAVSVAMVISAINALSLSPALCSVLLKPGAHAPRGPMRYVMGAIDYTRDGYAAIVKRLVRVSVLCLVALAAVVVGTGALFRITPTGFLPQEDQGAFFVQIALPQGASLNRTQEVVRQAEQILSETQGIVGVTSIVGLDFLNNLAQSNSALLVVTLASFEERLSAELQVDAILRRVQPQLAALRGATAFAFNLPPIIGLGSTGGFEYQLQDLGGREVTELAQVMRAVVIEANQQPELLNVFSTFAADTPQLYLDLDRNKAQTLGVQIDDVFTALQGTLGGLYVNDFNLFGRTWQVNIQADQDFRRAVDDIFKIHVRNAQGEMVPIRTLASVRLVLGPSALIRYNLYRSATINGSAAAGYSTGDALAAMERLSATTLP
ncbi:MAG: efflux RND transporter permease subunit, partial [Geminicoccaceae bacterium]